MGAHLANIVRANCGDGLESQLLAADTHEDLLHLAQEILLRMRKQKQSKHSYNVNILFLHTLLRSHLLFQVLFYFSYLLVTYWHFYLYSFSL